MDGGIMAALRPYQERISELEWDRENLIADGRRLESELAAARKISDNRKQCWIDAQNRLAEIETRLIEITGHRQGIFENIAELAEARKDIAALKAQLAEARKDTERLDWMDRTAWQACARWLARTRVHDNIRSAIDDANTAIREAK